MKFVPRFIAWYRFFRSCQYPHAHYYIYPRLEAVKLSWRLACRGVMPPKAKT